MSADFPYADLTSLEEDRATLRVEISRAQVDPLEAAWLLGRVLNELWFRLKSDWICFDNGDPEWIPNTWSDISYLAEQLDEEFRFVATVRNVVEDSRSGWESAFQSEWHSDAIENAIEMYGRRGIEGGGYPNHLSYVQFLDEKSSLPDQIVDPLILQLKASLPPDKRKALELGQLADQLIHPPLWERILDYWPPRPENLGTPWEELPPPIELSRLPLPNGLTGPWPDARWRHEAQRALSLFCASVPDLDLDDPLISTDSENRGDFFDDLQCRVTDASGGFQEMPPGWRGERLTRRGQLAARRFQLTFDFASLRVSNSRRQSVRLEPVQLRLLLYFLNRVDNPVQTQILIEDWGQIGRNRLQSDASARTRINELNGLVTCLGIEIVSDSGYHIVRCPGSRDPIPDDTDGL